VGGGWRWGGGGGAGAYGCGSCVISRWGWCDNRGQSMCVYVLVVLGVVGARAGLQTHRLC